MNQNTQSVNKSLSPEESAVVSNIAALLQELQGMSASAPVQEPVAESGGANPGVQKESEQGRQEGADAVMNPNATKPADRGMAPWKQDDEVTKALATIAKAFGSSPTDGPTANDKAEQRLNELPDEDKENIASVAKALATILAKKPVAKSMVGSIAPQTDAISQLTSVVKSMADRQARQDAILGEILEGLGVAGGISEAAPTTVQKSQDQAAAQSNRPYASLGGADLVDTIAAAVVKSLGAVGRIGRSSGLAVAKGFEDTQERKSMNEFAEAFAETSQDRWAVPIEE